ncbi:MAG: rhodanese-like domain-containing protein [Gammaproteobacteria bacterium]|nr:rhodanese-like domain-containing protein [Gammaproteobacteria bacterium]
MHFVINNWYLFLALIVVVALLVGPTLMQYLNGIQSLTPAQLVQMVNRQNAVVVDVSESNDYSTGHVPNAINVPYSSLHQAVASLDKYKTRPLVVTCRTGSRSLKAALLLRRKYEFPSVHKLSGGLAAWERQSLPLEK